LATNLKVKVLVFVVVDFEVTTTVAVQSTPGVNPVIVTLFIEVILEFEFVNTVVLSTSLVTETPTKNPETGIFEVNLIFNCCEVPKTAKTLTNPGSSDTINAIGDSTSGIFKGCILTLLQENNETNKQNKKSLVRFIF